MSFEITTAMVQQYTTNVQLLLQQRGSRLERAVMVGNHTGKAAKAVEQIGPVAGQKRTSRHADTPLISTPHDGRWVFPEDYEWADLIDEEDQFRTLIDPTSSYAMNGSFALGRNKDDEIIEAFFGTAKTGENGSTNTAFDTSNQQIAAASSGLTIAKLREAKKILLSNEVDMDFDELFIACSAEQLDDMLAQTEVTSADYNNVKALVDGKVDTFMGFKFLHTERLGVDGSSNRRVAAWAKSGMHLGIWGDIRTSIKERADKSDAVQVLCKGTFGATRTEEGKVVEILCAE